jgi:hypothetical protein
VPLKRRLAVKPGTNVRYVVPQIVGGEERVHLYARVKRPERNVTVSVGAELSVFRRAVKPPELVTVELPKGMRAKNGKITVSVRGRSKR